MEFLQEQRSIVGTAQTLQNWSENQYKEMCKHLWDYNASTGTHKMGAFYQMNKEHFMIKMATW